MTKQKTVKIPEQDFKSFLEDLRSIAERLRVVSQEKGVSA